MKTDFRVHLWFAFFEFSRGFILRSESRNLLDHVDVTDNAEKVYRLTMTVQELIPNSRTQKPVGSSCLKNKLKGEQKKKKKNVHSCAVHKGFYSSTSASCPGGDSRYVVRRLFSVSCFHNRYCDMNNNILLWLAKNSHCDPIGIRV